MRTKHQAETEGWESWPNPSDFIQHCGLHVEVRRINTQRTIIRGEVVTFTDLLGGPGILQYGNYGEDASGRSVVLALAPPPLSSTYDPSEFNSAQRRWREKYREWVKCFQFRSLNHRAGKRDGSTGSP